MGEEKEKEDENEKPGEVPEEKAEIKRDSSDDVQVLTGHLKRLQAEFENYKKRVQKETAETKQRSKEQLLCELLPILDEFEIAMRHPDDKKGFEMLHKKMVSFLRSHGVECIECIGKKFDPEIHNATEMLEAKDGEETSEEGVVVQEIRKGYVCNGRVLRHADVCVSKKDEKNEKENEKNGEENERTEKEVE